DEIPFLFRLDTDGLPRLRTLVELAGQAPVRLSLAWSGDTAPAPAEPAFSVGASADAGIALAVLDAAAAAERHGAVLLPDSDVALVVEATGTLRARLSLAAVAGAYQATGTESLALLHEYPPQETTLAVLLDVPRRLPRRV